MVEEWVNLIKFMEISQIQNSNSSGYYHKQYLELESQFV